MENFTVLFPSSSMVSSNSRVQKDDHGRNLGMLTSFEPVDHAEEPKQVFDQQVLEQGRGEEPEGKAYIGNEGKIKNKKVRNPRLAFQTRSPVDILDDGYRWRKYGQKEVKNNKFPRSYYRCTQHGCSVKKQVQRLSTDESVVVTTYDGIHNHHIEKPNDNFEHILSQMQIYTPNL